MGTHVATLSEAGWVSGVAEKLDLLLAYYQLSEHSQSNTYLGRIASLPYHIQQFGDDELRLRQAMQDTLSAFIGRHVDQVDVNVNIIPMVSDPGRLDIHLRVVVVDDGTTYDAGWVIQTIEGKLAKIFKLNNESGDAQ